jgi:hypothetical protein
MKNKTATPETVKPPLKLIGRDGNAFAILGAAQSAARKAGWPKEKTSAFIREAMSGDYDNLLALCMKEFDVR